MSKILMISTKSLKENYHVDDNLADKYLMPIIQKGMDFKIRPIIGNTKYDEIINEIDEGELSPDNDYLMGRIEPVLAYFVLSEVVYATAYKFKNKGLEEGYGEKFEELVKISRKYAIDSQHYEMLLKGYFQPTCELNNSFKTGLFIG